MIEFLRYIFSKPITWEKIKCRFRGHPDGPVWFNMGENLEPDMRCKNCGDYI